MKFSRLEYWSGWPIPSPAGLPNSGIEPRSPALQADSLPAELSEGFLGDSDGKASSACKCGRPGFNPWVRKIPWRRKWQPTPVFLPGKFHGQRSLVGYNPWSRKERLSNFTFSHCKKKIDQKYFN